MLLSFPLAVMQYIEVDDLLPIIDNCDSSSNSSSR